MGDLAALNKNWRYILPVIQVSQRPQTIACASQSDVTLDLWLFRWMGSPFPATPGILITPLATPTDGPRQCSGICAFVQPRPNASSGDSLFVFFPPPKSINRWPSDCVSEFGARHLANIRFWFRFPQANSAAPLELLALPRSYISERLDFCIPSRWLTCVVGGAA